MNEIWKPIPGYSYYEVSSLGMVRSYRRFGPSLKRRESPKVLKLHKEKRGYLYCGLVDDAEQHKSEKVHKLVALAFLGPRPEGLEICHNDGNKTNNVPANLRYDTHLANMRDAIQVGALPSQALMPSGAKQIRELYTKGTPPEELAKKYNVSRAVIWDVIRGRTYKNAGGPDCKNLRMSALENKVKNIRLDYAKGGVTTKQLGERYGMDQSTICDIVNGKSSPQLGGPIKGRDY